jgi:hypothetical protein
VGLRLSLAGEDGWRLQDPAGMTFFLRRRNFCLISRSVRSRQNPIFNPALNGKAQEWQQNGGEFDKPLIWMHFCALALC